MQIHFEHQTQSYLQHFLHHSPFWLYLKSSAYTLCTVTLDSEILDKSISNACGLKTQCVNLKDDSSAVVLISLSTDSNLKKKNSALFMHINAVLIHFNFHSGNVIIISLTLKLSTISYTQKKHKKKMSLLFVVKILHSYIWMAHAIVWHQISWKHPGRPTRTVSQAIICYGTGRFSGCVVPWCLINYIPWEKTVGCLLFFRCRG